MNENAEGGISNRQVLDNSSHGADRMRPNSPDRILSAVGNEYRRAILDTLTSASNETVEYDALVMRVADRVWDADVERDSEEYRRRIRIALHHTHLPKLEEVQMVDYETDTGQVKFVGGTLERDILTLVESTDVDK